jgi:glucose-1-phosphate adenylyltransferase
MLKRHRVFAFRFQDYWQDIGTPEAYFQANLDFIRKETLFKVNGRWPVYTGEASSGHTREDHNLLRPGSNLTGSNCLIKGTVENSVLSRGVLIGENSIVRDSVIMANVSIGRNTCIFNSIIDENTVIGEHCVAGEPDSGKLTIFGQNSRVPSYANNYPHLEGTTSGEFDSPDEIDLQEIIRGFKPILSH